MQHNTTTATPPSSPSDAASAPLPPPRPRSLGQRLRALFGERGSQRRVLGRNAAWNWAAFITHAVAVYFLAPYLVRSLGKGPYGFWETAMALVGYLGLGDLGVRPAIVHFVARHDARGEKAEVNRYVNTTLVTLGAMGLLGFGLVAALGPFLLGQFGVSEALYNEALIALLILAATFAITLPLNAFSAVLIGKQRFDITCKADLTLVFVRTAGVILVLEVGGGLIGLAIVHLVTELIEMAWKSIAAFANEKRLRFKPRLANWKHARKLLTYGGMSVLIAIGLQLSFQTDAIVIAGQIGVEMVALFAFAAKLADYTRSLLQSAGRVLTPAIGAIDAVDGDSREEIARLLTSSARTMLIVAAPLLVFWVVLGGAFLEAWVGERIFRTEGAPVLIALALGSFSHIASYPLISAHYGIGALKSLAILAGIEGVLNLGISIALAPSMGILGVALGTAIPGFVIHTLVMPWYWCRRLEISAPAYLARVYLLPLGVAAICGLAFAWLFAPDGDHGWGVLIGGGIGLAAVYFGLAGAGLKLFGRWLMPKPQESAA